MISIWLENTEIKLFILIEWGNGKMVLKIKINVGIYSGNRIF